MCYCWAFVSLGMRQNTQTKMPHRRSADIFSGTFLTEPVWQAIQMKPHSHQQSTALWTKEWPLVWYLELPLGFWKRMVSSNSISGRGQLLDDHILLMQETRQTLAVRGHPAAAVWGPFAPIKLDGVLGHLVLLQHGERPHHAEAQQPTCNLHPKPLLLSSPEGGDQ